MPPNLHVSSDVMPPAASLPPLSSSNRSNPPAVSVPTLSSSNGSNSLAQAAIPEQIKPSYPDPAPRARSVGISDFILLPSAENPSDPGNSALSREALIHHLDALQLQVDSLSQEITLLRRRDETLNGYMNRLDEELRLAARLQQDFLPKTLPQIGRTRFHSLFRPAGYVSGDLYDVMRLDENHVGFYIADAVGHGMPAALLTMFIKTAMVTKQITPDGYRILAPGETLAKLNASIVEQNLTQSAFATAVYGIINAHTLRIQLARAGHPSPMLIHRDGSIAEVNASGGLLGIFPDEQYETITFNLEPGERLLLYSDGVELAFNDAGETDTARWRHELELRVHRPAADLLADFGRHLDNQAGSITPKDDLTLILLQAQEL